MSEEETVFDPNKPTSGCLKSTTVGDMTITCANFSKFEQLGIDLATALNNMNRNLAAIEAAILGTDIPSASEEQ